MKCSIELTWVLIFKLKEGVMYLIYKLLIGCDYFEEWSKKMGVMLRLLCMIKIVIIKMEILIY